MHAVGDHVAEAALTGAPPRTGSDAKSVLVDGAEVLGGYGLEMVLVVLVGIGVAISLGGDLLLRQRGASSLTPRRPPSS